MKKNDYAAFSVRTKADVLQKLDFLCEFYGWSRRQFIENAILLEFDKVNGNPTVKIAMDKMKELAQIMQDLSSVQPDSIFTGAGGADGKRGADGFYSASDDDLED